MSAAEIHPTAIVHPKAELAGDVTVGPYCIIEQHVQIGAGTRLMHNVFVTGWNTDRRIVRHPPERDHRSRAARREIQR